MVREDKSVETAVTLLNLSSPVPVWYLTISPTLTPENNLPALFKVFPPLIFPSVIPFENFLLLKTLSAVNTGNPEAFCATDLISLVPYAVTAVATIDVSTPLIFSCSPLKNVPEV